MNKQKTYWIIGAIAAVILILLILFFAFGNRNNPTLDSNTEHNHNESIHNYEETAHHQDAESADQQSKNSASSSETTDSLSQYLQEQDMIMSEMMTNMAVEPSGNASIDFLRGMIPHHKSAIDMAESYLKYGGTNSALKQLAVDIIEAQTGEIEQMNHLIQEIETSGEKDEKKEQNYLKAYEKMMSGHHHMNHGTSSNQDVEQAFAEGMMMHHQMAVDMSRDILNYTDHEEVRQLAEMIIQAQEKEIQQMQSILNQ